MKPRSVQKIVQSILTLEGEGFLVRRPFPTEVLDQFDPFLLLDHFGPVDVEPGEAKGAPDHPHRGFETVTYMLDGEFEHKDSVGNHGHLHAGDVQWMTAGAGVVHSEMPAKELQRKGGRLQGFQLWVNLPKRDKMMKPRYQDVPASRIPVATSEDGKVRVKVIAGEALGARAVIETRTPIAYLHFTMEPGGEIVQPLASEYAVFAYVTEGAAHFGPDETRVFEGQMVGFSQDGDAVRIRAQEKASVLVIAGVPLREPVARYGPFVMNTREEIQQAFDDFRSGKMGKIG